MPAATRVACGSVLHSPWLLNFFRSAADTERRVTKLFGNAVASGPIARLMSHLFLLQLRQRPNSSRLLGPGTYHACCHMEETMDTRSPVAVIAGLPSHWPLIRKSGRNWLAEKGFAPQKAESRRNQYPATTAL